VWIARFIPLVALAFSIACVVAWLDLDSVRVARRSEPGSVMACLRPHWLWGWASLAAFSFRLARDRERVAAPWSAKWIEQRAATALNRELDELVERGEIAVDGR
jgi:hypothetical protein